MSRFFLRPLSWPLSRYRQVAIASLLLTFVLLVIPGDQIQALGRALKALLGPDLSMPGLPSFSDKLVHALLFALCGFFLEAGRFLPRQGWPGRLAMLLNYAVLTELVQMVVPGRSASIADFTADALGAALGLCLARWLGRYSARPKP